VNNLVIVNGAAGGHRGRDRTAAVLAAVGAASHTAFTMHPRDARDFAVASGEWDTIVVLGGDGTVLGALNGMDLPRQRLAVVPMGRGNSLARALRLYPVSAGLAALRNGRVRAIDLMDVTFTDASGAATRLLAASTIALGYPVSVVKLAGARFRALGPYGYAAAAAVAPPRPISVELASDGGAASGRRLTGLIVNNTRFLANFAGFPLARPDDGRFEVMQLRAGRWSQNLHNLSVLTRLHAYEPADVSQAGRLRVALETPEDLMVDGEVFTSVCDVRVELRPRCVQVMCAEQAS